MPKEQTGQKEKVPLVAAPGTHDEPAVSQVVRWIADEVTALLFDGIAAASTAED